jgi:hypothetical protein
MAIDSLCCSSSRPWRQQPDACAGHVTRTTEVNMFTSGQTAHRVRGEGKLRAALSLFALLLVSTASAQDLTPRAYWPVPVGTDVFSFAYQYQSGDIVTDPTLPISGVDSDLHLFQPSHQRSFDLLGRTATVQFSVPYLGGTTQGFVDDSFLQRRFRGFGDARARLAVNLIGAPAMDAAGFQALRAAPRFILGTSFTLQAPTGQYDADRLLNLGTNRWAFRPAVGAILPLHRTWLLEAEVAGWLFSDNDDFLGQTRTQKPIFTASVHLIKRIRPGFWASLDANVYRGGQTRVGDRVADDLQRNARTGVTVVFPFWQQHALRVSFSTGVATRSGGNFDMLTAAYTYAW